MNASSHSIKGADEKQDNLHCDIHPDAYAKRAAAGLLQHQRRRVTELARRRAQREYVRGIFRSSLTRPMTAAHDITAPVRGGVLPRKR